MSVMEKKVIRTETLSNSQLSHSSTGKLETKITEATRRQRIQSFMIDPEIKFIEKVVSTVGITHQS
jgi:hypothetical protein